MLGKWMLLGTLWGCVGPAAALEEFSISDLSAGTTRSPSGGALTIQANASHIYLVQFSPALAYRIRNDQTPGWAVVIRASPPSWSGSSLSGWGYQAGTGTISGSGGTLGFTSDAGAVGSLASGLRVLQAPATSLGEYVYQLGQFQFTMPELGPAATYQTQLSVTLIAGGP